MMEPDNTKFDHGAATLIAGLPLIFPTDTVYGLGVAVGIAPSPEILYEIKERDHGKPVAWLVSSPKAMRLYAGDIPDYALVLAERFWPGPLTLVLQASSAVKQAFTGQNNTIALRMPDNETALRLIWQTGLPIATTSANMSGQAPPKRFEDIDSRLLKKVPNVLSDTTEKSGKASSVLDCTGPFPRMLREGTISLEQIKVALEQHCIRKAQS